MKVFFTLPCKIIFLLFGFLMILSVTRVNGCYAQAPTLIYDVIVSSGLSSPVDIVHAGDNTNRLFIVEQGGRVKIFSGGLILPGNFLEIPDSLSTGGERGLLSIAFHPDYENNRYFFVYYTNTAGDITIARFQTQALNPDAADEASGVVLLNIPKPFSNHNGGRLLFGPDGKLYFATGDGGSGGDPNNLAQNGNSLLGKMIRLDVDDFLTPPYYVIPPDNPYVSDPLVRDEIFAIGLRNPWRWSFDRLTGDVWIADVGQGSWEEINNRSFATSGGINYGWRCYEGNAPYNTAGCLPAGSYITPIFNYPHNFVTGGFSVTGGHIYRGVEFPALFGYYICADYVSGNTWLIISDGSGGWTVTPQSGLPGSIAGFGEAENGDLYAVGLNGIIYKLTISVVLPVTLKQFGARAINSYNEISWETSGEINISAYEIEFSYNAINYQKAGSVNAVNNGSEKKYSFQHLLPGFTKVFYRLKIIENSGRTSYSAVAPLTKKADYTVKVYPMPLTEGRCTIFAGKPVEQVILFTMEGKILFTKSINPVSGTINLTLPDMPNGMYIMKLKIKDEFVNQKILVQH